MPSVYCTACGAANPENARFCSQCGTPCYVFEMQDGHVLEAMCLTCGNNEVALFNIGDQEDEGE